MNNNFDCSWIEKRKELKLCTIYNKCRSIEIEKEERKERFVFLDEPDTIARYPIFGRKGEKGAGESEFLIWRVSRDRLDGRQRRIRGRKERAAEMNLSHCPRFNGYARLSIPSRFFRRYFRWQILSCRTMWSPSLNAPPLRSRSLTLGNLRHCFSGNRARGHIGIANVPVCRDLMKTRESQDGWVYERIAIRRVIEIDHPSFLSSIERSMDSISSFD